MARSFQKPDLALVTPEPFLHKLSGTRYTMLEREGTVFQRRWRVDPDDKPAFVRELSVDFVMGSGNHARSFLHQTPRGGLLELPLAWYPAIGWAMSPGHDRPYSLPPRSIAYECMFCHNGYPAIPPRHEEPGAEPLYAGALPQGIDCQRCHGVGDAHIAKAQSTKANSAEIRAAIVNPARLSTARQLEVCMQCHLETTALPLPHSLLQLGRGPFSYKPGEPLGDFIQFFDHAPGSKYENDFEIAHSAFRLRKSQCFLKSAKMTCTTCHDPHDVPRGERATQHYNEVCGSCHVRRAITHPAGGDCVACHMVKRQTQDVIHATMTDHLIARRPPLAEPPRRERLEFDENQYRGEVKPYYPATGDPLLTAIAQVAQKSDLARGLPRLVAEIARQRPTRPEPYIELGQAWVASGKLPNAIAAFEEALRRQPGSRVAALGLSDVLTQTGQTARAIALLTKSSLDEPLLWYQLGLAYSKANQPAAALEALSKTDPDLAEGHDIRGTLWASLGNASEAETAFRLALTINPDLSEALGHLGQLLGIQGKLTEAQDHLARSIQLKPNVVEVRINYSVALAAVGLLREAQEQIDAAIRLNPRLANAHYISGLILEKSGQIDNALVQIELALRLQPDYGQAHLAAARLYKAKGNLAVAQRHLQRAGELLRGK